MKKVIALSLLTSITSGLFGAFSVEKSHIVFFTANKIQQHLDSYTLRVEFKSSAEDFALELEAYMIELARIHEACPYLDTQFLNLKNRMYRGLEVSFCIKQKYVHDVHNRCSLLIKAIKDFYRKRYSDKPELYAMMIVVNLSEIRTEVRTEVRTTIPTHSRL
jgi:hypothetical protein